MKLYAGELSKWEKEYATLNKKPYQEETFGPNLGFIVHGFLGKDYRGRGFDHSLVWTSLVVKEYHEDGKHFVETLNSIYELI